MACTPQIAFELGHELPDELQASDLAQSLEKTLHTHDVAKMPPDKLFDVVAKDGVMKRAQFSEIHQVIVSNAHEEFHKFAAIQEKEKKDRKRLQVAKHIIVAMATLLALMVAANGVITLWVVEYSKEMHAENNAPVGGRVSRLTGSGGDVVGALPVSQQFNHISATDYATRLGSLQNSGIMSLYTIPCSDVRTALQNLDNGITTSLISFTDDFEEEPAVVTVSITCTGGRCRHTSSSNASGTHFWIHGFEASGGSDSETSLYDVHCETSFAQCGINPIDCPVSFSADRIQRRSLSAGDAASWGTSLQSRHKRALAHFPSSHDSNGDHDCDKWCHPSHSTLELLDGRHVRMDEASVGQLIRTPRGYEPIVGFLHAEATTAHYLRFTTASTALSISKHHFMLVNGIETDSEEVVLGDMLSTPMGPLPVLRIEQLKEFGAYHIIVPGGTYYVDGLLTTDYFYAMPMLAWKFVLRPYVTLRYLVSMPIIPAGKSFISPLWLVDLLMAAGVPNVLMQMLSPLIFVAGFLTELVCLVASGGVLVPALVLTYALTTPNLRGVAASLMSGGSTISAR